MAHLQREHLPPLSANACLAWSFPRPTRRLAGVGAVPISGVESSRCSGLALVMPLLVCFGVSLPQDTPGHLAPAKLLPVPSEYPTRQYGTGNRTPVSELRG